MRNFNKTVLYYIGEEILGIIAIILAFVPILVDIIALN